ncbi:hypothetical protein PLICRDRAFT_37745 [Plicaturopsis crispa FD-325 SS-3]|nr:hypothetical protein PLICRDRAFT_37745 [Plicaturopsis crispa FD-325 SS-3]
MHLVVSIAFLTVRIACLAAHVAFLLLSPHSVVSIAGVTLIAPRIALLGAHVVCFVVFA